MQQLKLMKWMGWMLVVLPLPAWVSAQSLPAVASAREAVGEPPLTELPKKTESELPDTGLRTAPEPKAKLDRFELEGQEKRNDPLAPPASAPTSPSSPAQPNPAPRFRWRSALQQSLLFLAVEHGFRIATEPGTRADLKGPFLRDWFDSAGNLRGWRDGDPFIVNYIGHSMQGAVTGFIQIQNDPLGLKLKPGFNRAYVRSRTRAFWWSAAYSTQFELGPLSESSLGNVGLRPTKASPHPQAFVDMVITPVVGTAWLVGEDTLDHHFIRRIENKTTNRVVRLLVRSFFNPGRSFANAMRGKYPWYRDDRKL